MIKMIGIQLRIKYQTIKWALIVSLGMFLIGAAAGTQVMRSGETYYVPAATMIAAMGGLFVLVLQGIYDMRGYYETALCMGRTRRRFAAGYCASEFLLMLGACFAVKGMCAAELAYYRGLVLRGTFSALEERNVLEGVLRPGMLFVLAAALTVLSVFFGTLAIRFGVRVFWGMWGVWLFATLVLPQIAQMAVRQPDSVFGRLGTAVMGALNGIPAVVYAAAGALLLLAALLFSVHAMLKGRVQ